MSDETEELRMFSFTNFMLSPIQQGIQPAHAMAEMFAKYRWSVSGTADMLHKWAANHKTMVCKNGGAHEDIENILATFEHEGNEFPWAPFYESQDALNSSLTSVAIIVPSRIFDDGVSLAHRSLKGSLTVFQDKDTDDWIFSSMSGGDFEGALTPFEFELAKLLRDTHLAR